MPEVVDPSASARRLDTILHEHMEFRSHVVPLCAAETPVSEFVRSFLVDPIHEKYAMGGPLVLPRENFIGSEFVLDLHQLTIDLCREIFEASYADPRPHSGTGAVTNLLMTLSEPGQRILLQTSASGGHASMAPICARLGLEIVDLPYEYDRYQIDADACRRLDVGPIDFVLFAPSDILYPPDLAALGFADTTTVVYDATQTLGMIASRHLPLPFGSHPRLVVSGGTHKTLPGPSSGLLMTQNGEIAERLDSELSPKFVRHSHPHHTAALCATLIEQQQIGRRYSERIREFAGVLSRGLTQEGLTVLQDGDRLSETHQVFVHVPADRLDAAYARALSAGITLNAKRKPLFHDTGLRLGVQEIARYDWTADAVADLATVIANLVRGEGTVDALRTRVQQLAAMNRFAADMSLPSPRKG